MELLTPERLKKLLVRLGEAGDVERVERCDSEAAVGNGENYCSNIVRLRLRVRLTSGKVLNKTLVLKVFLQNLEGSAHKEMKEFFANEATMYEDILVHLGNLAKKHGLNDPMIWPVCYSADTDVLVFEDLKEAGFTVAPRHDGLKLEDGLKIISFIGRLHALSVTAERRKLINPLVIRRTYTWVQMDNWTSEFIRKGIRTAGDILVQWGGEWEELGKKMQEYSGRVMKILNDLFADETALRVVNHGDAWINNLMIRYDKDNSIESARFVDFQNATYNSYAWDLTYFLYTSLQGELMMQNYDRLLTSYREEFVDTLKRLGEPLDLVPSLDQMKSEVSRLHPFCLTMCCTVMPAVFNISEHPIQVDELTSDDDFKLRSLFTSDNWKSTIKLHVKHFQRQGVL